MWYTHRQTPTPPQGAEKCTDEIPSSDWDLSEIWYATSDDGFTWQEQGVAIKRPEKPLVGWRSVTTADILEWEGKFYLYYQGFMEASGKRGDDCPVAVSWADSPDGPWTVITSYSIHYTKLYEGRPDEAIVNTLKNLPLDKLKKSTLLKSGKEVTCKQTDRGLCFDLNDKTDPEDFAYVLKLEFDTIPHLNAECDD